LLKENNAVSASAKKKLAPAKIKIAKVIAVATRGVCRKLGVGKREMKTAPRHAKRLDCVQLTAILKTQTTLDRNLRQEYCSTMKFVRLQTCSSIIGCCLLLMNVSCAIKSSHSQNLGLSTNQATRTILTNGDLIEIAVLKGRDGQRTPVVLTRGDIVDVLGENWATVITSRWTDIEVDRSKLVGIWLHNSRRSNDKKLVESYLAGLIVHKAYSLAELRVKNPQELLEKFFEKKDANTNAWWMKKGTGLPQLRFGQFERPV
jgi:hypothetical protein